MTDMHSNTAELFSAIEVADLESLAEEVPVTEAPDIFTVLVRFVEGTVAGMSVIHMILG